MVGEMIIKEMKNSIGENLIFFIKSFRYEGEILDCDGEYLKYQDNKKHKPMFKKLNEITEWEIL